MRSFLAIAKALSDESRLRALLAVKDGELCLCQIIDLLGLAPSTVSKHMTLLHQAGLLERRKRGRWHFYRLADDGAPPQVKKVLDWVLESLRDDPVIGEDARRLGSIRRKDLEDLSACYRNS